MTKRRIKVFEGEKVIYDGVDNRAYAQDSKNTIFGMPIIDAVKLIAYLVMLIVFLIKSDMRITKLEEGQAMLIKMLDRSVTFEQNSDAWHSTVLSTQFKDGKPLNDNVDVETIKKNFIRTTNEQKN